MDGFIGETKADSVVLLEGAGLDGVRRRSRRAKIAFAVAASLATVLALLFVATTWLARDARSGWVLRFTSGDKVGAAIPSPTDLAQRPGCVRRMSRAPQRTPDCSRTTGDGP